MGKKKKSFHLLKVYTAVFISDIWKGSLDLFLNILSFLESEEMDKEAWEILLKLDDGYLGLFYTINSTFTEYLKISIIESLRRKCGITHISTHDPIF